MEINLEKLVQSLSKEIDYIYEETISEIQNQVQERHQQKARKTIANYLYVYIQNFKRQSRLLCQQRISNQTYPSELTLQTKGLKKDLDENLSYEIENKQTLLQCLSNKLIQQTNNQQELYENITDYLQIPLPRQSQASDYHQIKQQIDNLSKMKEFHRQRTFEIKQEMEEIQNYLQIQPPKQFGKTY